MVSNKLIRVKKKTSEEESVVHQRVSPLLERRASARNVIFTSEGYGPGSMCCAQSTLVGLLKKVAEYTKSFLTHRCTQFKPVEKKK